MNGFRLQNIKGFLDSGMIELRPLTFMIGQNSSGKSSLVRFPLVLKQTFLDFSMAPLLFNGDWTDYGNYDDVVFKHEMDRSIQFELKVLSEDLKHFYALSPPRVGGGKVDDFLDTTEFLLLRAAISFRDGALQLDEMTISDSQDKYITTVTRTQEELDIFGYTLHDDYRASFEFSDNQDLEKFLINYHLLAIWDELEFQSNLLYLLTNYFNSIVNGIHYIGPVRHLPERTYRLRENSVSHVGKYGDFAPAILGHDHKTGGKLVEKVSQWLSEHLGFSLEIDKTSNNEFRIMITDNTTKVKNNLLDVGHGLSQLIPILVQTNIDADNSRPWKMKHNFFNLHILEQPELHLHPAAQASLADLFIASVQSANQQNKKFLIETHSEHLLIRLRRRIVEGLISPDDVAIYYTEKNDQDGSVQVRRLDIDENGIVSDWPEGFFEEDYQEAVALRRAIRNKQKGTGAQQ